MSQNATLDKLRLAHYYIYCSPSTGGAKELPVDEGNTSNTLVRMPRRSSITPLFAVSQQSRSRHSDAVSVLSTICHPILNQWVSSIRASFHCRAPCNIFLKRHNFIWIIFNDGNKCMNEMYAGERRVLCQRAPRWQSKIASSGSLSRICFFFQFGVVCNFYGNERDKPIRGLQF